MNILHTADWHIGQLFHEYDRTYEHQQFLAWLLEVLTTERIDILLVSGDVFDLSNPSAASVKMLYSYLNQVVIYKSSLPPETTIPPRAWNLRSLFWNRPTFTL